MNTKFQFNHDIRVWVIILAILLFQMFLLLGKSEARVRYKVNDSVNIVFPQWKTQKYSEQVCFIYCVNGDCYSGELIVGQSWNSDKVRWFGDPPKHVGRIESEIWLGYVSKKMRIRHR